MLSALQLVVFIRFCHTWSQFLWLPYGIGQTIIFLPCGCFYLLSFFLWSPCRIGQTVIFSSCGFFFFYLSIFFFLLPNLSRCRLDVCHTSTHSVALLQWGADADTLWSSALALCYSAGEYCASSVVPFSPHWTGRCTVETPRCVKFLALHPTPLPWLPVLANIEPPDLRRKAATDRLVVKAGAHESWPLHHDISNPPQLRLSSRKPLWCELEPADINSQWRESWKSSSVVNAHLVDDPTIRQPGFALPRQQWFLLNRFHTGQSHCSACKKRWQLRFRPVFLR